MLPTQLGRGLKQAGGGPCTSIAFNVIVPLGSPNTNLHYLVTMETGAACQPYSQTRACFLSAAALGLREAGSEYRVRFPKCHSPREVAAPWDGMGREICAEGEGCACQGSAFPFRGNKECDAAPNPHSHSLSPNWPGTTAFSLPCSEVLTPCQAAQGQSMLRPEGTGARLPNPGWSLPTGTHSERQ